MRIAFLISRFPQVSETFIINQLVGLVDAGCEIDIYARPPKQDQPFHNIVNEYGLLERTRYWEGGAQTFARRLLGLASEYRQGTADQRRLYRRALDPLRHGFDALSLKLFYEARPFAGTTYDVIHCHFGGEGIRGDRLRRIGALRGPLVVSFHGHDATSNLKPKRRRAYRRMFAAASRVTVNSGFIGGKVRAMGCPAEKIVRVPETIEPRLFAYRERSPIAGEPIHMVGVGRLVEKKGFEYAIQAVARLAPDYPELRYTIVGDGPCRGELERLIDALQVRAHVTLVGAQTQEQVRQWYDSAHLFLLASVTASDGDAEGQGVVLQEAQAAGLPVLATQHNGFPDSVLEGESAYLVPERDVDALASRLEALLKHPDRWPAMGRAGRRFVEQHFTIAGVTNQLLEIYRSVQTPESA